MIDTNKPISKVMYGENEIPIVGGGDLNWEKVVDSTLTEDVSECNFAINRTYSEILIEFFGRCNDAENSVTTGNSNIIVALPNANIAYPQTFIRTSGSFTSSVHAFILNDDVFFREYNSQGAGRLWSSTNQLNAFGFAESSNVVASGNIRFKSVSPYLMKSGSRFRIYVR